MPTTPTPTSSPYQWAIPKDPSLADPLRLSLHFHRESIVLSDYSDAAIVETRLVSALDVARCFAQELELSTGILPGDATTANTLWWARTGGGLQLALYAPPAVRTTVLGAAYGPEPPRTLRLPWPPLVFLYLAGKHPYVFAAKGRPQSDQDELFHCPSFNVFDSGRICVGSHQFPDRPEAIPSAFFESRFSRAGDIQAGKSRRHPHHIGALWDELAGAPMFPLDDLVPQLRVAQAMRIEG